MTEQGNIVQMRNCEANCQADYATMMKTGSNQNVRTPDVCYHPGIDDRYSLDNSLSGFQQKFVNKIFRQASWINLTSVMEFSELVRPQVLIT